MSVKSSNIILQFGFVIFCGKVYFAGFFNVEISRYTNFLNILFLDSTSFNLMFRYFYMTCLTAFFSTSGVHDDLQEPDRRAGAGGLRQVRHQRGREAGLQGVLRHDQ